MKTRHQERFRNDFKKIVLQNAVIRGNGDYLHKLHAYDKNGSHRKAILKALTQRDQHQAKLKKLLKGISYEEWKRTSTRLQYQVSRLKKVLIKKYEVEEEIMCEFADIKNRLNY